MAVTTSVKALLLPIVSIAYLGFCWTVYNNVVLVNGHTLIDTFPENLGVLKSGITTINILVIALGLWPVKTLITNIKSEEFFRSINRSNNGGTDGTKGVDLATAYSLSSPTLGALDTIGIIFKQRCSPYFSVAFAATLVVMAASALAPAALSVHNIVRHTYVTDLEVAAIPPSSVAMDTSLFNSSNYFRYMFTHNMENKLEEAASITWAEAALNVTYSFSVAHSSRGPTDSLHYIVPLPIGVSPTASARWLTDAFVIQPSCSWKETNVTGTVAFEDITNGMINSATLAIPDLDIGLLLTLRARPTEKISIQHASTDHVGATFRAFNISTEDIASGGHSIWVVSQYRSRAGATTVPEIIPEIVTFDWTIPTFAVNFDGDDGVLHVAILACSPNLSIETVEVQNQGMGLTISRTSDLPTSGINGQVPRQGNIDQREGDRLLMSLFTQLGLDTSPAILSSWNEGSQVQASLICGWDRIKSESENPLLELMGCIPMPISNITAMYTKYIQSAAKPYMTGILGTSRVPGVISEKVMAFTVSFPHLISATILLAFLNIANALSLFRSGKGQAFNFFTIASALNQSNVPAEMARFRGENPKLEGEELHRIFEDASKNRVLTLGSRDNGRAVVLTIHDRDTI
ncbi:hypothetical protein AX16_011028 [Volvariella volvacea WC 439]|nr:hypothetical protein AX16_011028 [Volvariella volvacea WC 439]